jgi:hypothetical protein
MVFKKMRQKYNTIAQRKRRAYQLKYRIIPTDTAEVRRLQSLLAKNREKLMNHRIELHNMEAEFEEVVTRDTFLETLKKDTIKGRPKGIKIPKSIGGKGK